MVIDDRPVLGSDSSQNSHLQELSRWALRHGCTWITRRLVHLIARPEEPRLIGTIAHYLGRPQTAATLGRWQQDNDLARHLHHFSSAAVKDPPAIDRLDPRKWTTDEFRSSYLETDYLAFVLGVRAPQDLSPNSTIAVEQLRTWLVIKSLVFEGEGVPFEKRLQSVCINLRLALEGGGADAYRLQRLATLVAPADSLAAFEAHLKHSVEAAKAHRQDTTDQIPGRPTWWKALLPKLADVTAQKDPEPIESLPGDFRIDWSTLLKPSEFDRDLDVRQFADDKEKPVPTAEIVGTDTQNEESEEDIFQFEVPDPDTSTPLHAIALGTTLALKSQEGLNFLPYSFENLRRDEREHLFHVLGVELTSNAPARALLAALSWIAILTRRTLVTVTAIHLTPPTDGGWHLDVTNSSLHRNASRRRSGWSQKEAAAGWISPVEKTWTLKLADGLIEPIRSALGQVPAARQLGQLWTEKARLETAFNDLCKSHPELIRVRSGMVAQIGEQMAFEESQDATYARLVHAPPGAGLPGAAAYPSWSYGYVQKHFSDLSQLVVIPKVASTASTNGLGSQLDPIDDRLKHEFADALKLVEAPASDVDGWIQKHNRLVAYVCAAILAATGMRPVRSLIEDQQEIDLDQALAYIEDKVQISASDGHAGRLVPLPRALCAMLRDIFLPHRSALLQGGRHAYSGVISSRKPSLPFLFFIDPASGTPEEVSEESLTRQGIFQWQLPWNLFRHRLPTRLRTTKLDPELIDAQLGHSEIGATTFGDHSPRCFSDDLQAWRPRIEEVFALLDIRPPTSTATWSNLLARHVNWFNDIEEMPYGRLLRHQERIRSHDEARKTALSEIEAFVGGRPPQTITADEWDLLGHSMLFTEHNTAQTAASIRYDVFERYMAELWLSSGFRPGIRRWYSRLPPTRPAFSSASLWAGHVLDRVAQELEHLFESKAARSTSNFQCAWLAMLDLAVSSGISQPKVLLDLVQNKKDTFSLVSIYKSVWLEYSCVSDVGNGRGLRRHRVPARSVTYLASALARANYSEKEYPIPTWSKGIAEIVMPGHRTPSAFSFIAALAKLVDARNTVQLPGIAAAALAGRIETYAPTRETWIRGLKSEARFAPNGGIYSNDIEEVESLEPRPLEFDGFSPSQSPASRNEDSSVIASSAIDAKRANGTKQERSGDHEALKILHEILRSYQTSDSRVGERKNQDTQRRRTVRNEVRSLYQRPPSGTCAAVLMLIGWVLHLLERPYQNNRLNVSSIRTYLSSLAAGFLTFGPDGDPTDYDEEEITEFYQCIVIPQVAAASSHANEAVFQMGVETDSKEITRRHESMSYTLARLQDFHRFASAQYGLADPNWRDIDVDAPGSAVSSGFITPVEYEAALRSLCPEPGSDALERVRDAYLLLLTYRFGLRIGEAVSVERSSWVSIKGAIVVLVTGRLRQLKTVRSRRQVPLIGTLSEHETAIHTRWHAYWESSSSRLSQPALPLFWDQSNPRRPIDSRIVRPHLLAVLKAVTRNAACTIHHARHSYANFLMRLLITYQTDGWVTLLDDRYGTPRDAQKLLLGTDALTRRRTWAMSRMLGHSSPATTLRSYVHIIWDWVAALLTQSADTNFFKYSMLLPDGIVDLDKWPLTSPHPIQPDAPEQPAHVQCLPSICLEYFRRRAIGVRPASAGQELRLSALDLSRLETVVLGADARVFANAPPAQVLDLSDHSAASFKLGAKVTRAGWDRLQMWAKHLDTAAVNYANPAAVAQLSNGRQILAWSSYHVAQIGDFIAALGWSLDADLWTSHSGTIPDSWLSSLRPEPVDSQLKKANRSKRFQVDSVTDLSSSGAQVAYKNRLAFVLSEETKKLETNYELMLLWLCFHASGSHTSSGLLYRRHQLP